MNLAPHYKTTPALVQLRGVQKHFQQRTILNDVSITLKPGEFTVLLGPSGSGKTTLLRCVAGIERVDGGEIVIDDHVVASARLHVPPEKRSLAMVFQDYVLWPHMTVSQNVEYSLRRHRVSARECAERARAILDRVGLLHHVNHYPSQLSGGEQQRVALARALVASPSLLLFDEPLSNLDADLRERLRVEISVLTREIGCTVLYITHDQGEAFALADSVGILRDGTILQLGSPEEIYSRPSSQYVARFTGLAGELAGRLTSNDDGELDVMVGGVSIRLTDPQLRNWHPNQKVILCVRPGAVALTTNLDPLAANNTPTLIGTVVDAAFRGQGYEHLIELPSGERLARIMMATRLERSQRIGVTLDPQGCFVFPSPADLR